MRLNKKILLYLSLMLFMAIMLGPIDKKDNLNSDIVKENNTNKEIYDLYPPKISDGDKYYQENNFDIINDNFNADPPDWAESGTGTVTREGLVNMYMRMEGGNANNADLYATYSNTVPEFINGEISFRYRITGDSSTQILYCEVYTASGWTNIWLDSGATGGSFNNVGPIDLSSYSTNNSNINVRFRFFYSAQGLPTAIAEIDDFQLETYEFCALEKRGDPIDPDVSQKISVFVCPNFPPNFWDDLRENNVTLKYRVGNSDLSSPDDTIVASQTDNNFTFTIPESAYYEGEIVYYNIWINNDAQTIFHSLGVKSFNCRLDTENPTIDLIGGNYTAPNIYYDDDILVTCNITDNFELENAIMYIANETTPTINHVHVSSNYSSTPEQGGIFEFVIPSKYLTAKDELWFRINATDYTGRETLSSVEHITIKDDVDPFISFIGDNSAGGIIDCNESLKISYKITEPEAAIGLFWARLYVKVGTSVPNNGNDYNRPPIDPDEVLDINGGIINFTIPVSNYSEGNNVYYWVNATDLSSNMNDTFADFQTIGVVDNTFPRVDINLNNYLGCSYDVFKTLTFIVEEPPGGSGINSDSLILYYKLNDKNLLSPNEKNVTIAKYGGILNIIIDGLSYKLGDVVYYQLNVSDLNGNKYSSSILNYSIVDLVKPHYIEDGNNTNGWIYNTYKILNFTVKDPHYDTQNLSSGIASIEFYWRASFSPTTVTYDDKFSIPTLPAIVKRNQTTYAFNLTLDWSMFNSGPNIFYIINVTDHSDNYNVSSAKFFTLFENPYISNSFQIPDAVIPSRGFDVSFDLNFYSEVWYTIDNVDYYDERDPFTNSYFHHFDEDEGPHEIIFHMANNLSTYTLDVEVDLTAPRKISEIFIVIYGFNVVELSWDPPEGIDDESYYEIYRSTNPNFEISTAGINIMDGDLLARIEASENLLYEDDDIVSGTTYYYIIISIDRVGNISVASATKRVDIPENMILTFILIAVIATVAGISVYMINKKVKANKREKYFSQVDVSKYERADELDLKKQKIIDKPQWSAIQTKAPIVTEGGIDFAVEEEPISIGKYWENEIGKLISQATNFELDNDYGKALSAYTILIRASKRLNNPALTKRIEAKILNIYSSISE